MNIELDPKTVLIRFLYFIIFLLFANVIGLVFKYYFDHDYVYGLVPLFNFDMEKNVPTLYSSFALILCAMLLSIIALKHKRLGSSYLPWFGLAFIFLFLSIDEIASIHENLIKPTRSTFNTSGLLYYAWVIPYGIALVVFLLAYLKFLMHLPRKIMMLFIISGVIYVSGALGFELIGGLHADSHGTNNLMYSFITTCEEFLEMLGVIIFIYSLLYYIISEFKLLTINITANNS